MKKMQKNEKVKNEKTGSNADQFVLVVPHPQFFRVPDLRVPIRVRPHAGELVLPTMMVSVEPGISKTRLLVHEIVSSGINRHRIGGCKDADVRND